MAGGEGERPPADSAASNAPGEGNPSGDAPARSDDAPSAPASARLHDWRRNPWIRRLPLLLVGAVGIWLWKGGSLKKREIYWLFPLEDRPEITGFSGTVMEQGDQGAWDVIKMEQREFPRGGAPSQVEWELPLKEGEYRFFGRYARAGGGCSIDRRVKVEEEQVSIVLPRAGSPECRDGSSAPTR